jgi:hypothetical protein
MILRHSHNYIASTETVPADSLTCSTVGLAKFVTLCSLVLECTVKRSFLLVRNWFYRQRPLVFQYSLTITL